MQDPPRALGSPARSKSKGVLVSVSSLEVVWVTSSSKEVSSRKRMVVKESIWDAWYWVVGGKQVDDVLNEKDGSNDEDSGQLEVKSR